MTVTLYTASWCTPCQAFAPRVKQICADLGVDLHIIDLAVDPDAGVAANIRTVPTLVVGKNKFVGTRTDLRKIIEERI